MQQPPFPAARPSQASLEHKPCPACLSSIPREAEVCRACGTRIAGEQCEACLTFCPEGARLCRCCGNPLSSKAIALKAIEPMTIEADALATLLLQWSLHPQRIKVQPDKLTLSSFSWFGFAAQHEEPPWEKVAGFSHRSGLIWDAIAIETRGQTAATISCLSKRSARRLKGILQSVEGN